MLAVVDLTLLTFVVLCTKQLLAAAQPKLVPCEATVTSNSDADLASKAECERVWPRR